MHAFISINIENPIDLIKVNLKSMFVNACQKTDLKDTICLSNLFYYLPDTFRRRFTKASQ